MVSWRRPFADSNVEANQDGGDAHSISEGSLQYVAEKGGNDAPETYQEATGAPVEKNSPLGFSVGPVTIMFLNISMMIGTGIYSTPSAILTGTGSVGVAFIYWTIGFFISLSSACVYLEYAAYFPSRSGSEAVYLEQAFPRPKFFFPVSFAIQNVILSYSASNAVVLAQYLFKCAGRTGTAWELKGVAIAGYSAAYLLVSFHTRASYLLSNTIGTIKVLTLIFIGITGLVCLGGHTRVEDPTRNFRNAFQNFDGAPEPYGLTNALYRIIFSYAGYANAFNVVNEVKNPVKTLKRNGFFSLLTVTILYLLANIAFFAAVDLTDLAAAKQTAATLFFTNVFGESNAVRGLNFLIALSSFGNLIAVLLGQSRMIRETGRQGVLPWTRFWVSTKPFGTPLGPYTVKWGLTLLVLLALPQGDAFNFAVDLGIYPSAAFSLAMAIGLYTVRWRRKKANLPRATFRAWDIAIIFNILVQAFLLIMPWWPPAGGKGDVSFWYGTYVVVGIAILVTCGLYYYVYVKLIPRIKGYELRQEVVTYANGDETNKLVKVPVAELERWDASHDVSGRPLSDSVTYASGSAGSHENFDSEKGGAAKLVG